MKRTNKIKLPNGSKVTNFILDRIPILDKMRRRYRWAQSFDRLRSTAVTKALGWGCMIYEKETNSPHTKTFDGIEFTEFMPERIRNWYGISEFRALKIQALDLNNAPLSKISKMITSYND